MTEHLVKMVQWLKFPFISKIHVDFQTQLMETTNWIPMINEISWYADVLIREFHDEQSLVPRGLVTIVMHSLPELYQPVLQMIAAVEQASAAMGGSTSKWMKPQNLMSFFIREHSVALSTQTIVTNRESAFAVHGKKPKQGKAMSPGLLLVIENISIC